MATAAVAVVVARRLVLLRRIRRSLLAIRRQAGTPQPEKPELDSEAA